MTIKYYNIHQETVSEEEAKKFILNYYDGITKKESRYQDMLSLIDKKGDILDYGCGWGCFSKILSEKGNNVLGIDIDENSLKIAKEIVGENNNLKFRNIYITELKDSSFDYAISIEVLEHTHNPGNYLVECNRILKKDGYLIISIPNIININFFAAQILSNKKDFLKINEQPYLKTKNHIQACDPKTFCKLIVSLGFKYENHIMSEGIPFLKKYIKVKIPYFYILSYTMTFKFRKEQYVKVKNKD